MHRSVCADWADGWDVDEWEFIDVTGEGEVSLFTVDGESYRPSEFTRGPWRPDAMHGGPPAALLAHVSEPHVGDDEFISHIEVELTRPVPLDPIEAVADKQRVSGRVHRIHAELTAGSEVVARSNALVLQKSDIPEPHHTEAPTAAVSPPDPGRAVEPPRWATGESTTYHRNAVEHRFTGGTFLEPGPAVDWIRLRQPIVAGAEPTSLQRIVAAADFGSGISAVFGPESNFGMINANLTVSLARELQGEWVSLDARTHLGDGTGLAISMVGDVDGLVGIATQSLLGFKIG